MPSRSRPTEVILEVGLEGGSIALFGVAEHRGWRFFHETDESAMADLLNEEDAAGLDFSSTSPETDDLEVALVSLDRRRWHMGHPVRVHPAFAGRILAAVEQRAATGRRPVNPRWRELCAAEQSGDHRSVPIPTLMRGSPPAPVDQVTLANWRKAPWSRWAFRNVRRLLPTAAIRRGARATPLQSDLRDIGRLAFARPDGGETDIGRALAETHTDGLIVLRGGRIAFEWYDGGFDASASHIVFSVSKSILGALTGILADRGIVDPAAPVARYLPEVARTAWETATVRHLLDMNVAIDFAEDYEDTTGALARYRVATGWDPAPAGAPASDLRGFLRTLQTDGTRHGAATHYASPNTDLLGWLVERAAGQDYAALCGRYLWEPAGMASDADITLDRSGAARAAGGVSVSLRDMARLGELMRTRGLAGGRQVVPGWWIDDIRRNGDHGAWERGTMTALFPQAAYRSKWYNSAPSVFCAIGIHGQWIYVDEDAEVVVARVSSQPVALDLEKDHLWLRGYAAIAARLAGRA